jgi:hypothetical protein
VDEEKDVAGEALIGELPVQYFIAFESIVPPAAIRESRHFNRRASNSSLIVSVRTFVPEPPEFVAEIVTEKVPPTVGVPVMAPVEVLKFNHSGRGVAL